MKPKIYATGNETLNGEFNLSYYIFEKDASFLDWLGKLLEEVLEIKGGDHKVKTITKPIYDDKDQEIGAEIYLKNIKKMIDVHEKYESQKKGEESNKVDVFYGQDRVYVTLRKTKDIKAKFTKFVRATKEWIAEKELKNEIPIYAEKKK